MTRLSEQQATIAAVVKREGEVYGALLKEAEKARFSRDAWIRTAIASGMSTRAVGELAGMSHANVAVIAQRAS